MNIRNFSDWCILQSSNQICICWRLCVKYWGSLLHWPVQHQHKYINNSATNNKLSCQTNFNNKYVSFRLNSLKNVALSSLLLPAKHNQPYSYAFHVVLFQNTLYILRRSAWRQLPTSWCGSGCSHLPHRCHHLLYYEGETVCHVQQKLLIVQYSTQ